MQQFSLMATRRRVLGRSRSIVGLVAAFVLVAASVGGSALAPASGAQSCGGSVSTALRSPTLPGGEWSVTGGCLPSDSFYEYADGAIHAQAALSTVTYDDGHVGRVAVGILTMGEGIGLGVVGVEDSATGLIKWSAVLGDYQRSGDTAQVAGNGVTLFPTEPAGVTVSISGTGQDVTAQVNDAIGSTNSVPRAVDQPSTTTTVADPPAVTDPAPSTSAPATAVPSTAVPSATPPLATDSAAPPSG